MFVGRRVLRDLGALRFTGKINRIIIDLKGMKTSDKKKGVWRERRGFAHTHLDME